MNYAEGDVVYHQWAFSDTIPPAVKVAHGFHKVGKILQVTDDEIFDESGRIFWDVLVDKDVTQWREDLIALAS